MNRLLLLYQVEKWLTKKIRKGGGLLKGPLWLISKGYEIAIFFRHFLFSKGILKESKITKPVISVGSPIAGGSGKTPLVEFLAKEIGLPVAILSRGYRAQSPAKESKVIESKEEGDEPFLLAKKLPFAKVIVGKKRVKSGELASHMPISYILLDDGMQHRYLSRDLEIVILRGSDLVNGTHFLPRGFLRDSLKRLVAADVIFINGPILGKTTALIQKYTKAPLIGLSYEVMDQEKFKGKKVAAFCGIANPDSFFQILEDLNVQIIAKEVLADHAPFPNLHEFIQKAKALEVEMIVCTEKDFIKLDDKTGITPVEVSYKVTSGHDHFHNLLNKITAML